MDLLIASIILFLVFLSVFSFYSLQFQASEETKQRASASRIAELIAWNANGILQSMNGTTTVIRIPPLLATGDNYSILFVTRQVIVSWKNKSESRPLLTRAVSGAGAAAPGKNVSITNADGGIAFAS